LANVIEPPEERTYERGAGFGGHDRLRSREAKRDVDLNALLRQRARSLQAGSRQRALDNNVRRNLRIFVTFPDHAFGVFAGALGRYRPTYDLANRRDVFFEIDIAFFGDQRWVGGYAV